MPQSLPRRIRKLIGLFILLTWITVYALAVMSFAVRFLPDTFLVQAGFYLVAGFAWIVPLRPLIYWMEKP